MNASSAEARFRTAYAEHRASEGRALDELALFELPYLRTGPVASEWAVKACSFDTFVARVLEPLAATMQRPLTVADLGAGNGWLSWRVAERGHSALAVDVRDDDVDGLGAARAFAERMPARVERCVASFDRLPLPDGCRDLVVFNASLHYATDLDITMHEARRILRDDGRLAIIDSPFYAQDEQGVAMVEEKRRAARARFGARAAELMALRFVEYLTRDRLEMASPGMRWTRHRVRYPLWYELRPLKARIGGRRSPSRFDVWEGMRT
jgi:SAM-dependent methyltransferase